MRSRQKGEKMNLWDTIKKDVQKGIKEGMSVMKEGAAVAREKAEELTAEGKRRYKILDLKMKIQREMSELGGKVYDLSARVKNPLADKSVKGVIGKIKKLETQIMKIEGRVEKKVKKATTKTIKKLKTR